MFRTDGTMQCTMYSDRIYIGGTSSHSGGRWYGSTGLKQPRQLDNFICERSADQRNLNRIKD